MLLFCYLTKRVDQSLRPRFRKTSETIVGAKLRVLTEKLSFPVLRHPLRSADRPFLFIFSKTISQSAITKRQPGMISLTDGLVWSSRTCDITPAERSYLFVKIALALRVGQIPDLWRHTGHMTASTHGEHVSEHRLPTSEQISSYLPKNQISQARSLQEQSCVTCCHPPTARRIDLCGRDKHAHISISINNAITQNRKMLSDNIFRQVEEQRWQSATTGLNCDRVALIDSDKEVRYKVSAVY